MFVFIVRLFDLRLFEFVSSSLRLCRAAVCDGGTPWTFLLPFLCPNQFGKKKKKKKKKKELPLKRRAGLFFISSFCF